MTHLFDPPTPDLTEHHNPDGTPQNIPVEAGSVLANPNFLSLWSGQIFSQIADKVFLVLIIAIISTQFQQAGETISGWVSAVMVAFTIPAILFGSIAGVYVDRWSKKAVLVWSNLLRGGLVLAIPPMLWVAGTHRLPWGAPVGFWGLLTITFLVSTFTQFFTPAEQATITLIVDKTKLLAANSLYTTTIMGALILGFALGEPMLALAGTWLHGFGRDLVVGGCYLVAGLLLLFLKTGETRENMHHEDFHIWTDIKDGLNYLRTQYASLAAMLQLICTFSVIAALTVLAVCLAEVMPEIKSEQFGFLLADASVGMAIGAGVVAKVGHRCSRQVLALIGSLGMAVGLGLLAFFTDKFWLGLGAIALTGVFAGLCVIPMQTVIQEETAEEMRGKVFGLQNNAVNIALSLPLAVAGIAESYFGLPAVIFALSGLTFGTGVLTWFLAKHITK